MEVREEKIYCLYWLIKSCVELNTCTCNGADGARPMSLVSCYCYLVNIMVIQCRVLVIPIVQKM